MGGAAADIVHGVTLDLSRVQTSALVHVLQQRGPVDEDLLAVRHRLWQSPSALAPRAPIASSDEPILLSLQKSIATADHLLNDEAGVLIRDPVRRPRSLPNPSSIPLERSKSNVASLLPSIVTESNRCPAGQQSTLPLARSASSSALVSRRLPSFSDIVDMKKGGGQPIGVCISKCHSAARDILRNLLRRHPDQICEVPYADMAKSEIVWTDHSQSGIYAHLLPHQRVNHLPQMHAIVTKSSLAKLLNLHRRMFASDAFAFVPPTWELPQDRIACEKAMRHAPHATYIVKPTSGLQGRHIRLVQKWDSIRRLKADQGVVVQRYIDRPLLVDGLKWDMRVYVLVEDLDPLRAFLFKDGLARFATEPYQTPTDANLSRMFMHLTNYSLNKESTAFRAPEGESPPDDSSSKRTISTVLHQLQHRGYAVDPDAFWRQVADIVTKTLIAMWPAMWGSYQAAFDVDGQSDVDCRGFHLVGFDILMDAHLKLWLLEVNSSPSFSTRSPVDAAIKVAVIEKTMEILQVLGHTKPSSAPAATAPGTSSSAPSNKKHLARVWKVRERRRPGDANRTPFMKDMEGMLQVGTRPVVVGDLPPVAAPDRSEPFRGALGAMGVIELLPERDATYVDLCLLKVPLAGRPFQEVDQWRRELRAEIRRERVRNAHDALQGQDSDPDLFERFLTSKTTMRRAARQRIVSALAIFEPVTRAQVELDMQKEVGRLLRSEMLALEGAYGRTTRASSSLPRPRTPITTDELIATSNLSAWRLFKMVAGGDNAMVWSSSKFLRLLSACQLTSRRGGFSRADADLLFLQITQATARHSRSIVSRSASNRAGRIMTFELFCEAIMAIAQRRFPGAPMPSAIRRLMVATLTRINDYDEHQTSEHGCSGRAHRIQ